MTGDILPSDAGNMPVAAGGTRSSLLATRSGLEDVINNAIARAYREDGAERERKASKGEPVKAALVIHIEEHPGNILNIVCSTDESTSTIPPLDLSTAELRQDPKTIILGALNAARNYKTKVHGLARFMDSFITEAHGSGVEIDDLLVRSDFHGASERTKTAYTPARLFDIARTECSYAAFQELDICLHFSEIQDKFKATPEKLAEYRKTPHVFIFTLDTYPVGTMPGGEDREFIIFYGTYLPLKADGRGAYKTVAESMQISSMPTIVLREEDAIKDLKRWYPRAQLHIGEPESGSQDEPSPHKPVTNAASFDPSPMPSSKAFEKRFLMAFKVLEVLGTVPVERLMDLVSSTIVDQLGAIVSNPNPAEGKKTYKKLYPNPHFENPGKFLNSGAGADKVAEFVALCALIEFFGEREDTLWEGLNDHQKPHVLKLARKLKESLKQFVENESADPDTRKLVGALYDFFYSLSWDNRDNYFNASQPSSSESRKALRSFDDIIPPINISESDFLVRLELEGEEIVSKLADACDTLNASYASGGAVRFNSHSIIAAVSSEIFELLGTNKPVEHFLASCNDYLGTSAGNDQIKNIINDRESAFIRKTVRSSLAGVFAGWDLTPEDTVLLKGATDRLQACDTRFSQYCAEEAERLKDSASPKDRSKAEIREICLTLHKAIREFASEAIGFYFHLKDQ